MENSTTVLNLLFLVIATVLLIRFLRTGGPVMLCMMKMPTDAMQQHGVHVQEHSDEKKEIDVQKTVSSS